MADQRSEQGMCASGIEAGICLDITGISGEDFASHQTFGHAALKNSLKHMAEKQQLWMFPSCTCISTVGLPSAYRMDTRGREKIDFYRQSQGLMLKGLAWLRASTAPTPPAAQRP